jgi:RNA polymerase sigma factor (sigma-70 family)
MPGPQALALPRELRLMLEGLSLAHVSDDQRWLLSLMRANGVALLTMLWRMLGREADVLDAYQSAVCQLVARGPDGIGSNPGGYFYRVAMNAGIEILRRRRQQREAWPAVSEAQALRHNARSDALPPDAALDHRELIDRMRRAIYSLPPHLRSVTILRDLAQLPYSRVASILGITSGTARLYRRRAILKLAELIGEEAAT